MGITWSARRVRPADAELVMRQVAEAEPEDVIEAFDAVPGGGELYIDKSWHGIHMLLTGTPWQVTPGAGSAVLGGAPLVEEDQAVRYLTAEQVAQVAKGLTALDLGAMRRGFDPGAFAAADIYPAIWDERGIADTYLMPYLGELVSFYAAASRDGNAVITFSG